MVLVTAEFVCGVSLIDAELAARFALYLMPDRMCCPGSDLDGAAAAAFEDFINKDNRVSKLLAKFVSDVLKKGTKVRSGCALLLSALLAAPTVAARVASCRRR